MSVKSDLHQVFLNNIAEVRDALGLTQGQAAERMGVTQATYSAYESGKGSPTLDLVERIAVALGVADPSILLKRPTKSSPPKPHLRRTKKPIAR